MTTFMYYNVNEEGTVYDRHGSLAPALAVLEEFPNDTMVTVVAGSPGDEAYQRKFYSDDVNTTKCRHCGEAIELRNGDELVTKFGNDPQCDDSPNDNHQKAGN